MTCSYFVIHEKSALGRLRRFGADAANVGSRHVCDGALPRAEASAWVPKPNFGEQAITRPQPGTGQLSHLRRTSQLGHSWSVEPRCVVDEIAPLLSQEAGPLGRRTTLNAGPTEEEAVRKSTGVWIGVVRPSRRPLRGLLRMRSFLNAIKGLPHAEERPNGRVSKHAPPRGGSSFGASGNFMTASKAGAHLSGARPVVNSQ